MEEEKLKEELKKLYIHLEKYIVKEIFTADKDALVKDIQEKTECFYKVYLAIKDNFEFAISDSEYKYS